jgi:hypothetical protein
MLTVNTEMPNRSAISNTHDFYPKNFNHVYLLRLEFERYRNHIKNRYKDDKNMLDVNEHQVPDHART